MIGRRHAVRVVPHQIGYDGSNSAFFVIEHDRCATACTGAQFQGTVGVLIVEWLTFQAIEVINYHVSVIKKRHMSRVLTCHPLADGAVACVAIDGFVIRVSVYVVAPSRITMRHVLVLIRLNQIYLFSHGADALAFVAVPTRTVTNLPSLRRHL